MPASSIQPTTASTTAPSLISDGKIADFGPSLFASGGPYGHRVGRLPRPLFAPGLVDARVHTGEPGEEHKETLESAGVAAAVGGITSMVLLPDNDRRRRRLVDRVRRPRARQINLTNMYAYGALTVGLEARSAEMGLLAEAGAVAFTDADHPWATPRSCAARSTMPRVRRPDRHLPQEPTLSAAT